MRSYNACICTFRLMEMGCCGCFGFSRRHKAIARPKFRIDAFTSVLSQTPLLDDGDDDADADEDVDDGLYNGEDTSMTQGYDESEVTGGAQRAEEIINFKIRNGLICRQFEVKETRKLVRSEVSTMRAMKNLGLLINCCCMEFIFVATSVLDAILFWVLLF